MSRWNAHLNRAKEIIAKFDGKIPLSSWLKDFFRQHKEMGSSDRRIVSELVFGFFRLGHAAKEINVEERILAGLFLSGQSSNELLNFFKPELNAVIQLSVPEKIKKYNTPGGGHAVNAIFPWWHELSDGIDPELFSQSFLQQPDLFIRVRPCNEKVVNEKLINAGIRFTRLSDNCISLPNGTKLDSILDLNKEAVIQDYNSQRTGDFFSFGRLLPVTARQIVWDCCAASGGKSIMAFDIDGNIDLTVSDVRKSILNNLVERFHEAGIKNFHSFIADLSDPDCHLPDGNYHMIIADLPCSGSGTWARTPEQLYFFDPAKIQYYGELQKKIVRNVVRALKPGGRLVYITCSVFREENEAVANFIRENFDLELLGMELLKGYGMKADSMFVAVFAK